jgi:segregation and condensation protein B
MYGLVRLIDKVQALLFVADSPASTEELSQALEVPEPEIEDTLEKLGGKLSNEGPLQLVRIAGGYQLCTKPECAEPVARFLKPQSHKLTRSVMEVLAIVAYKQPVTGPEIDAIRGVQSDYGLGQLIEKRLVAELGRKNAPGRPVLYGTTQQFLHLFNLDKLDDLPDLKIELDKIGADVPPEQPALIES